MPRTWPPPTNFAAAGDLDSVSVIVFTLKPVHELVEWCCTLKLLKPFVQRLLCCLAPCVPIPLRLFIEQFLGCRILPVEIPLQLCVILRAPRRSLLLFPLILFIPCPGLKSRSCVGQRTERYEANNGGYPNRSVPHWLIFRFLRLIAIGRASFMGSRNFLLPYFDTFYSPTLTLWLSLDGVRLAETR